jgi:hypothetical protein
MLRLRPVTGETVGVDLSQSRRPGWEPGGFAPAGSAPHLATVVPIHADTESYKHYGHS